MRAWWLWAALAATLLLCGCGLIAGVTDVPEVASSEDAGADAPIDTGSPQDTGMARDSAPDAPQVGDSAGDTADAGPPMDTSPPPTYTVGGTVSGLIGTMVVLMDNGGDPLTVSGNGPFVFSSGLAGGTTYDVTVTTGAGEVCTVTNGTGTITTDVTNVAIACFSPTDAGDGGLVVLGGTLSGLAAGGSVVLQDTDGNATVTLTANGSFMFATPLAAGSAYAVAVETQPSSPPETCTVTNGNGTATATVTNIMVVCQTQAFTVGGTVSGLMAGDTVVLEDNGGDNLTVHANGMFTFATPVANGAAYAVTVLTQPTSPAETCTVTANASGTVAGASVATVSVACVAGAVSIGGTLTGLTMGNTVVLQDNGGDSLTLMNNGTFSFTTPVMSGSPYAVTVSSQPSGQACTVSAGSGTANTPVTSVVVNCAQNQFLVGGTVSGLGAGNTIHIELNGAANSLFVTSNGQFAFPSSLSSGTAYTVTITANPMTPISQTCAVTGGGSGTIMGASVTNVMVACTTISYTISGTVQGLGAGDTLTLLDTLTNTTDTLNLSSSSSFTFADAVPSGDFYNISITSPTSPVSQSCVLDPSSATPLVGTVASSNVTGILITCTTNTFTIGGTVTGLAANDTLTVKDAVAGNSNLITSASPSFTLATALPSGSTYDVTIGVQGGSGANQTCVVSGSSGMGTVANAKVTNVAITCTTNSYLLSVTVDGLMAGNSMVLTNNDTGLCASGCTITPTSNVEMLMVPSLTSYSFRFTTPTTPAQTCTPPSPLPAGQVTNAPVALTINCSAVAENLEVNVAAGLAGTVTVSDPDTGGGSRNITATGLATQWTPNAGSAYAVTIVPNTCSPSNAPAADVCFVPGSAAPTANQTCTITNPNNGPAFSGTMPNSALTADISCTTNKFTLGGYVTGLDAANFNILHVGSGQPSGSQSTPISGNDGYAFANPVTSGTEFNVLFTTGTQQYIAPAGTSLTGTVVRIGGATPANWQQCQINNQAPGGVTGQLTYMGNVAVPSSPGTSAGGVNIACVPAYSLGGTVTFPTSAGGSGLVLTNTVSLGGIVIGTDTTAVISGTGTAVPFTMNSGGTSNPTPLAKGDTWSVAVTTTATGRTCNVTTGATGTMGTANVTNLVVTCM